jgi:hypothetical protein
MYLKAPSIALAALLATAPAGFAQAPAKADTAAAKATMKDSAAAMAAKPKKAAMNATDSIGCPSG